MSSDGVEVGAANNKVNHRPDHNRREVARGHAVIAKGSFPAVKKLEMNLRLEKSQAWRTDLSEDWSGERSENWR
jgi:hypothetical protein